MVEKKGFFSFFRGKPAYNEEESKQREYALSKKREEQEETIIDEQPIIYSNDEEDDDQPSELSDEMIQSSISELTEILALCGFTCEIKTLKLSGKKIFLEILNAEEQIGRIIGKDGATLTALQIILNAMLFKKFSIPIKVILDAGDYRLKKIDSLKNNALKAAKTVIKNRSKIALKPMNAAERRIIHMLFKNDSKVRSYSLGNGDERHVVLDYHRNGTTER